MATKVFISWSGDLSNKLAGAVRHWLPGVLQFAKPYFTPSDIEKGALWGSDILLELDNSDVGIICLTKENLSKPWILFEAGALLKNFEKSKVCTLLFDVDTTDLTGPLTIFQNTNFEKRDFKKLVKTINASGGDVKLEDTVLDDVFEMWWPKLEKEVSIILTENKTSDETTHRTERDILEEILELTRLNTRKKNSGYDLPRQVIGDLMDYFTSLSIALDRKDIIRASKYLERMEQTLRLIIERSSYRDLDDKNLMMRRYHINTKNEKYKNIKIPKNDTFLGNIK